MRPVGIRVKKLTKLTLLGITFAAAGCGQSKAPDEETATAPNSAADAQWSAGRDRVCLKGERAGLIVYAADGDTNCTVRGSADNQNGSIRIRPDGDPSCTIEAQSEGASLNLGPVSPACAYYCGPKASYAGKRLTQQAGASPAVDLAGDPLC